MKVIVYTDGGARGNPGPAGAGVYAVGEGEAELFSLSKYLGEQTNNYAEYQALILALEKLSEFEDIHEVEIRMDSQLIVRQLSGEYRVKEATLKKLYGHVQTLLDVLPATVSFVHVPREENKEADRLANEAMDLGE